MNKKGFRHTSVYLGVLIRRCVSVFMLKIEARFGKKALEKHSSRNGGLNNSILLLM